MWTFFFFKSAAIACTLGFHFAHLLREYRTAGSNPAHVLKSEMGGSEDYCTCIADEITAGSLTSLQGCLLEQVWGTKCCTIKAIVLGHVCFGLTGVVVQATTTGEPMVPHSCIRSSDPL